MPQDNLPHPPLACPAIAHGSRCGWERRGGTQGGPLATRCPGLTNTRSMCNSIEVRPCPWSIPTQFPFTAKPSDSRPTSPTLPAAGATTGLPCLAPMSTPLSRQKASAAAMQPCWRRASTNAQSSPHPPSRPPAHTLSVHTKGDPDAADLQSQDAAGFRGAGNNHEQGTQSRKVDEFGIPWQKDPLLSKASLRGGT